MSAMPISFIDRTKADWTLQRDACLVELLIEQQNAGNRSDTGWKKEAWKYMVDAFNRRFGIDNNVQQLKSRIAQLKKNYNIVRQLLNQGGFSWNSILHVVVADDDVWDHYLLLHPEAKPFRKAGLPLFEELGTLFDALCLFILGQRRTSSLYSVLRQAPDGGFQGRTNKASDTCYVFWVGGILKTLGAHHFIDRDALREFLLNCQSKVPLLDFLSVSTNTINVRP